MAQAEMSIIALKLQLSHVHTLFPLLPSVTGLKGIKRPEKTGVVFSWLFCFAIDFFMTPIVPWDISGITTFISTSLDIIQSRHYLVLRVDFDIFALLCKAEDACQCAFQGVITDGIRQSSFPLAISLFL